MHKARWVTLTVLAVASLAACDQLFSIEQGEAASSGTDGGLDSSVGMGEASTDSVAPDSVAEGASGDGGDGGESGVVDAGCGATCAVTVSAGGDHTCAVMGDQSVLCWGNNDNGECGPSAKGNDVPTIVPGIGPARLVKSGDAASCALLVDQSVWCWGGNVKGTVGVPEAGAMIGVPPVQVLPPGTALDIVMGAYHACITTTGSSPHLMCWGENTSGQAGVVDAGIVPSPTTLPITNVTQLAAMAFDTCFARSTSPFAECMGENVYGELGLGVGDGGGDAAGTDNQPHPTPSAVVLGPFNLKAFYHSNGYHIGAILGSGAFELWGANNNGQLGPQDDSGAPNPTPTVVTALDNVTALALSQEATCALRVDGTVWCWGSTANGETGNPANIQTIQVTPSQVVALPEAGATAISAGLTHVCAIIAGGGLECWGFNGSGQLGRSTSAGFDPTPGPVVF
jgi:alpha-tubulin suppressor-like RCC1 family protein